MAVTSLSNAFRRLNLKNAEVRLRCYSLESSKATVNLMPTFIQNQNIMASHLDSNIKFTPNSVSLNFSIPKSEMPINKIIEYPFLPNFHIEDPSASNNIEINDRINNQKIIEIPNDVNIIEKQAVRMIVIRRRKMKKHKRRKFLKKWRVVRYKKKLRKRARKDKIFQDKMQKILAKAHAFNAEEYVKARLELLNKQRTPTRYRGELLPEEMVKKFLQDDKDREEKKKNRRKLTLDD